MPQSTMVGGAEQTPTAGPDLFTLFLAVWLAIVLGEFVRAFISWRRITSIRRTSLPLQNPAILALLNGRCRLAGLARAPELRLAEVASPLLTGLRNPAILVPHDLAASATADQWGWIFAHEVAHMRRNDLAWSWMHGLVCCLYFFSPLVWLTRREWFLAQEIACDAEAIRLMDLPKADYARLLVSVADRREPGGLPALGVMDAYRSLERRLDMLKFAHKPSRRQFAGAILLAGTAAALCLTPWAVTAQKAVATDPNVRLAQQWEDVLLMEATDYLQLTPKQIGELKTLAEYAQSRADEIERQRAILKTMVEGQHQALLHGKHPTASEQTLAIQKERQIKEMETRVSEEVVDRLTPKLGAILTRKQFARAWQLVHGKTPAGESQRVALYDPESGFVLPEGESESLQEELVRSILRPTYSDETLNAALGGPGIFAGTTYSFADRALTFMNGSVRQLFAYRPRSAGTSVSSDLGLDVIDHFDRNSGPADSYWPAQPAVSQALRDAINTSAERIRSGLDKDPESVLRSASSSVIIDTLRHLTKRMFLSPRLHEALETRGPKE